jgi:hypothetical protein
MPTAQSAARALPEGYTWPELHALVLHCLRADVSVLLRGHPGVGKSALAGAVANALSLPLIDIRLAQRDPTDLAGVWFPDRERQALVSYPPTWALRAAAEPCLVFLDEINAAVTKLHQAAAYQIVLERRLGELRFHPQTRVLAAGNLEDDNAIVSTLSSALCNRFAHFTLRVDVAAWLDWASSSGLEPSIQAYIGASGPAVLYAQSGAELAFPSPRSWEMASRLLMGADVADGRRLVSACVGFAHADRFFAWRKLYAKVSVEKILKRGQVPDFTTAEGADPSFVYATTYAVADWLRRGGTLTDAQLPNVIKFLGAPGLDPEYAFLFLRHIRPAEGLFARLRTLEGYRSVANALVGLQLGQYA